jgi:hypothetical protein
VLLTGASSQLGVFLIPRLLAAGFRVIALSREANGDSAAPDERLLWKHPGSFGMDASGREFGLQEQVAMLISCGPIEVAIKAIALCPRLERVVAFSTSSVFSKATSPNGSENRQIADILARETQLQALCSASYGPNDLPWNGEELAKSMRSFSVLSEEVDDRPVEGLPPLSPLNS